MAKSLEEMNLIDNFLFDVIMSDETAGPLVGKIILETIFGKEFPNLKVHSEDIILPGSPEKHAIRMDAYIEPDQTELISKSVYDIEPDTRKADKSALPRRTRYYHSTIDSRHLQTSSDYRDLKDVFVIFITNYDPFNRGQMIYTIRNHCVEIPDLDYDDGAVTIFLYTKGTVHNGLHEIKSLLTYFDNSTAENVVNENIHKIHDIVDQKRHEPEIKEAHMRFQEYLNSLIYDEKTKTEQAEARAEQAEAMLEQEKLKNEKEKEKVDKLTAKVAQLEALLNSE